MNKGLKKSILLVSKVIGTLSVAALICYLLYELALIIKPQNLQYMYLSLLAMWSIPFAILSVWGFNYKNWYWAKDKNTFNEDWTSIVIYIVISLIIYFIFMGSFVIIYACALIAMSIFDMCVLYIHTNRSKEGEL